MTKRLIRWNLSFQTSDNDNVEARQLAPSSIGGDSWQIALLSKSKAGSVPQRKTCRSRAVAQLAGHTSLIDSEIYYFDADRFDREPRLILGHAALAELCDNFREIDGRQERPR